MGRTKGSKNKPKERTDNSVPVIQEEKPVAVRSSKKDGFIHGPCGQFWHIDEEKCPTCSN